MSDSDPEQLRFEVESCQGEPGPDYIESPSTETELIYHTAQGDLISYDEIDRVATAQGILPIEAMRRLGVTPADRTDGDRTGAEKVRPKRGKTGTDSVYVNVGERAEHILNAISEYDKSVEVMDKAHELLATGHDNGEVDRATLQEIEHRQNGDREFFRGWGTKALRDSGIKYAYFAQAEHEAKDFYDLATYSENREERDKLVANLGRQKDQ